ncbi:fungal specific transcription [Micractinium conductrix]|uniref:Fungal specific transcription n=1 Tax=Micractinium conductrix TaxID=554055 RepID=A0A2P6VBW3_9CHLO|nr:fungal specific transcription [Micractinium conductrix]|eukprot:PSC71551.1 fungal specific transcription [Micractinium conductrix]
MVVGVDGSLSRIANWDKLTEREREVALRRVAARNRDRLARLRAQGGGAAPPAGGAAATGQQQQQVQQDGS